MIYLVHLLPPNFAMSAIIKIYFFYSKECCEWTSHPKYNIEFLIFFNITLYHKVY